MLMGGQSSRDTANYLLNTEREPFVTVKLGAFGEDKANLFFKSRFFVLPTTYATEAVPISLIEALAAGCYVVSTNQGGISETLHGFQGAVVSASPEEVARAIERVIKANEISKIFSHNRRLAISRYSPERYDNAIRQLFGL